MAHYEIDFLTGLPRRIPESSSTPPIPSETGDFFLEGRNDGESTYGPLWTQFPDIPPAPQWGAITGLLENQTDLFDTFVRRTEASFPATVQANMSGQVLLANDEAEPGASMYYGTDANGTKGFFSLPAGGWTPPEPVNSACGYLFQDGSLNFSYRLIQPLPEFPTNDGYAYRLTVVNSTPGWTADFPTCGYPGFLYRDTNGAWSYQPVNGGWTPPSANGTSGYLFNDGYENFSYGTPCVWYPPGISYGTPGFLYNDGYDNYSWQSNVGWSPPSPSYGVGGYLYNDGYGNWSYGTGGSGSPGGSANDIQINSGCGWFSSIPAGNGVLGNDGSNNFTWVGGLDGTITLLTADYTPITLYCTKGVIQSTS